MCLAGAVVKRFALRGAAAQHGERLFREVFSSGDDGAILLILRLTLLEQTLELIPQSAALIRQRRFGDIGA